MFNIEPVNSKWPIEAQKYLTLLYYPVGANRLKQRIALHELLIRTAGLEIPHIYAGVGGPTDEQRLAIYEHEVLAQRRLITLDLH